MVREYVILVRMPSGVVVAIQDDGGELATFASEEAADEAMRGHILQNLPRQVVELDV